MSAELKEKWHELKRRVESASYVISVSKNEETEKEYDIAVEELVAFEKKYGKF